MSSRVLIYVVIAAAWTGFAVLVAAVQSRAQDELEQPQAIEHAEPPEPGQPLKAAA